MNTKKVSISLVLASLALQCASLTIGPARGAAWIGRPLELSIPVVHDTLSDATALCAHAEVYYAETRQDASRVHVQQEPTDQPNTVRLRVWSSTPIDEPVVTVNLRVGCEDKSMRHFVLLADFPAIAEGPAERALPELATAGTTTSETEPAATRALPASLAREVANSGATEVTARKAQAASAVTPTHLQSVAGRSTTPRAAVTKVKPSVHAAKPPSPQRARLQLDSVDILLERIKTLEAAAATPPVETVSKDSERLQKLENDLHSLREQTAKNGATLLILQKQLERAETERVSTEWLYGLVALVMLCALGIVMLWHRRRVPQVWNEGPPFEPDSEPEPYEAQFLRKTPVAEPFEPSPPQMPVSKAGARAERNPGPDPELETDALPLDVNLMEYESLWPSAKKTPGARP